MKYVISTFLLLLILNGFGQTPDSLFIDTIAKKIEHILPKNWFIQKNADGFSVFYCRTCSEFENRKLKQEKKPWTNEKIADKYFKEHGADSVSFYSLLSLPYIYFPCDTSHPYAKLDTNHPFVKMNKAGLQEIYKPTGVLKLDVTFCKKWTAAHLDSVKTNDSLLIEAILEQPLGKTSRHNFDDLRYWIPTNQWEERTKKYPFHFERLPYRSLWYNYSVFIIPYNYYYTGIMYYNKNETEYYSNPGNEITEEYEKIQQTIAYCLGIKDY